MIINHISDVFEKFKFSWASTGILTFSTPVMEQFFPVISQVILILSLQLISVGVDYAREKLRLKKRSKSDIEIPESLRKDLPEDFK